MYITTIAGTSIDRRVDINATIHEDNLGIIVERVSLTTSSFSSETAGSKFHFFCQWSSPCLARDFEHKQEKNFFVSSRPNNSESTECSKLPDIGACALILRRCPFLPCKLRNLSKIVEGMKSFSRCLSQTDI